MKNTNELEEIINKLITLGLSQKKAKILVCIVKHHILNPSAISRKTKINRSSIYQLLSELQKEGLVKSIKRDGLLSFTACDIKHFLNSQRSNIKKRNEAIHDLEKKIPELASIFASYAAAPQMALYSGKEGLIQVMEDTLKAKTELLCWADAQALTNSCLAEYYPTYIKKKVKNKLWVRGIFNNGEVGNKFQRRGVEELREAYLIPSKVFPFSNEINIYDDKVSIIAHQDEVGVIIQNKHIADTQRSIFKLGFSTAKRIDIEGYTFYKKNFQLEDFFEDPFDEF